ncbi:hypothetical protein AGABI2DRAFT_179942 [Agaricus bisporus var. bisporus H97]|uniref:hypothetical protein n=1 Tax=Agaricus bisporus var. bisporus (strain H97 / ATCC MYA-4626 / FGSC 10389) TaxID=936046 RepID=UPI00029F6B46|nr:hypothetical protein AGABI2DRAFT_179942 [Agaricus bisporus var. bisporus H97]EKV44334.1 hypothetical protein AGABI2DRAFT_179942 [Agaricus bisporus var. bisporus H97]
MRSFAAIATIATAAFAAVASALPALPGATNGVTDAVIPKEAAVPAYSVHHEHSVVQIIVDLTAKVQPLCDELTDFVPPIFAAASISGDVEVSAAVDISLDILGEIKGFIATAKADIQAAIDVNADLLVLNGETLAVKAVAEIVATLVIAVTTVLGLVVRVCASANVAVLVKLVADIGIELAGIISLVVRICADLVIVVKPLITVVANVIINLDLKALIQVLVLQGGSHY